MCWNGCDRGSIDDRFSQQTLGVQACLSGSVKRTLIQLLLDQANDLLAPAHGRLPQGTIELPGYAGGINWGGLAFDPQSQTAGVNSSDLPMEVALVPRAEMEAAKRSGDYPRQSFAEQRGTPYGMRRGPLLSLLGVPCLAPPWGTLSAVNMQTGTISWQIPFGSIEDIAPAAVPNLQLKCG